MSDYISTTDIFGNNVSCTHNHWVNHIVANHEIMKANKMAVEDTITDPDVVYESDGYGNRRVFFKQSSVATYQVKLQTKVIVEYNCSSHEGEVVTAFPTKSIKGGISNVVYTR